MQKPTKNNVNIGTIDEWFRRTSKHFNSSKNYRNHESIFTLYKKTDSL